MKANRRLLAILTVALLAGIGVWSSKAADKPVPADAAEAPRHDANGYPLPAGAFARLGSMAFRHEGPILALAYSPDGATVATGGADGVVRLWDVSTGRETRQIRGHEEPVVVVAFAPDGKRLATADGDGRHVPGLPIPPADDDDGAKAKAPRQRAVNVWDVATGKQLQTLETNASEAPVVVFAPDGRTLVTRGAGFRSLRLWDVATGKARAECSELPRMLVQVGFVNHGRQLVAIGNATPDEPGNNFNALVVHDVASGRQRRTAKDLGADSFLSGTVSSDGKFAVTIDQSLTIKVWEVASLKVRRSWQGKGISPTNVADVALSPDGKLIAQRGIDRKVRVWETDSGRLQQTLQVGAPLKKSGPGVSPFSPDDPTGAGQAPMPMAFSPDGKRLAVGSDRNAVRFWDLAAGKEIASGGLRGRITAVAYSADGKYVATGGEDRVIRVWDAATRAEVRQLRGHTHAILGLAFAADGKLLASNAIDEEGVRLWDPATGKQTRRVPASAATSGSMNATPPNSIALGFGEPSRSFVFVPGTPWIATRGQETVGKKVVASLTLWDTTTGKSVRKLKVFEMESADAAKEAEPPDPNKAKNDDVVCPAAARGVRADDDSNGTEAVPFPLAVSADGKRLATAVAFMVTLWDPATGAEVGAFEADDLNISRLALSGDGKMVAAVVGPSRGGWGNVNPFGPAVLPPGPDAGPNNPQANSASIALFDAETGEALHYLEGHEGAIASVAFSPDGKHLATAGTDREVRIWDVASGRQLPGAAGHRAAVADLAFAPDGQSLVSASDDETVLFWKVSEVLASAAAPVAGLAALWSELGHADAAKAGQAIRRLSEAGAAAVPVLKRHMQPVAARDGLARKIDGWVADLESDQLPVRDKAANELEKCGDLAEAALEKVLQNGPALETQKRVARILKAIEDRAQAPEQLRALRAIEVLERIGTADARQLLANMAKGDPEARVTQEAAAALARLEKRGAP